MRRLMFSLVFSLMIIALAPSVFATSYNVSNVTDLQNMNNDLSGDYAMISDINALVTNTWNDNGDGGYYGFNPIGDSGTKFTGTFNGNGYTITNLYVNRPAEFNNGLFGYINNATIENIGMANVNIIGSNGTSGLIGQMDGGTITSCFTTGSVTTSAGQSDIGGLIGRMNFGNVSNCYSRASVGGVSSTRAGLIGYLSNGSVDKTYSTGTVSGTANGLTSGPNNPSIVTNSFWDNMTSGQATSTGGQGLPTTTMKLQITFTDNDWDFENIWGINTQTNNGYPYLLGVLPPTTTTPEEPENALIPLDNFDLWDDMTDPYTKLFPEGQASLFYVILFSVIIMGVYMKTNSAGAVVATLMILGVLIAGMFPGAGSRIFGVIMSVACAILLYLMFKTRG